MGTARGITFAWVEDNTMRRKRRGFADATRRQERKIAVASASAGGDMTAPGRKKHVSLRTPL